MKALLLLTSLLLSTTILAATHKVDIASFAFSPSVLIAEVGDFIEFTNSDQAPHSVISRAESPVQIQGSSILQTNDKFTLEVTEEASLLLHCGVHRRMPGIEIKILSEKVALINGIRSQLNKLEAIVK